MNLRIKEIMKEKGIRSVDLVEKLGITKASISNAINNKVMPSVESLERIAKALGVEFTELFERENDFVAMVNENGKTHIFRSRRELQNYLDGIG